jgi:hypothetical protein
MKKQILISLILSSSILTINAQIFDTGDKVGIGINNPEKKLQINASNNDAGLRLHALTGDNNTNTPYLLLTGGYQPNSGVALRGIGDQGYGRKALVFYSGWDGNTDNPQITDLHERLRISSAGFIGIGTSNPSYLLDIYNSTQPILRLYADNNSGQGNPKILLNRGNEETLKIEAMPNVEGRISSVVGNVGFITFYSGSNQERLRIASNGYIGIGTSCPKYNLDVLGTIRAQEVKVDLLGGCDFVFKRDYNLMDLKQLEEFVKTNQHLPGISPEKEMVENGLDMKDMQMKLLQKVEELTLYTIEQNKKIETIQEQNELLKQEIELLKKK